MRIALLLALGLLTAAASAQTDRLPQFGDYPAGPVYQGRVAPLVLASSRTAREYRTATRRAMAEGINFAGHYVVATWGCGTECIGGHIVDARTGRSVVDLPSSSPFVAFRPDSRLLVVMTLEDLAEMIPPGEEIPSYYQSSYWLFENGTVRHLGTLLAPDLEQIRRGGPVPPLRHASPGDVLVPLAVGNTWTYAAADGATVTIRVTGPGENGYGMRVERTRRGIGGEKRTVETWTTGGELGDGSFSSQSNDDTRSSSFGYSFGMPTDEGEGRSVEREAARVREERLEALCYTVVRVDDNVYVNPGRTCFVPRVGIVSDDRDGAMTLTSYSLR